jgi:hypothetical protein
MEYNLFEELQNIAEQHIKGFFESEMKGVEEISFSAEAIAPKKISINSNIADTDTYADFIEIMDKTMMNAFVDLFKKGENVEGSLISISFNYKDSIINLDLTAKKSSKNIVRKNNKEVDWYSISMANLSIDSKDSDFNDKETYLQRIQDKIKQKKIRNDAPEYFTSLLETIRVLLEKEEDRKKTAKDQVDSTEDE